ncbi:MAG: biopolymer transporter ExbD [Planctomycetes bacterium]|nr:biopolymer transporter ExbD [Planctomycetota bacterium]
MEDHEAKQVEGKLDLVPMIDCIMLLLLFFILTTSFHPDELSLSALLPNQGPGAPPVQDRERPISIGIYPAGLTTGADESQYASEWNRMSSGDIPPQAAVRIGRNQPLIIDGRALSSPDAAISGAELQRIGDWMSTQLVGFEVSGAARKLQPQVEVHCFSGLEWKHALVVYDAVRAFERERSGVVQAAADARHELRDDLQEAREVTLAAPRMRHASRHGLGAELADIMNLH